MNQKLSLREATQRRINRQSAAISATVDAWKKLRAAEAAGDDTQNAMAQLRSALDTLEFEMEKA